jgi:hypothetical protein
MKKKLTKFGVRPVDIFFEPSPESAQLMRVTRKSDVSGKDNTMDLPITEDHLRNWLTTTRLIQNVMPHLNKDQSEFLISGCTPEEWAKAFGVE